MDAETLEGLEDWEERIRIRSSLAAAAAAADMTLRDYLASRRVVARSRRIAETLGLAYWPAVAFCGGADPAAFAVAEKILARGAPRWGEIDPATGAKSHGGWDSMGHHGMAPQTVVAAWRMAGCRDSGKFRAQIASGMLAQKGESLSQFRHALRGGRWLTRHAAELGYPYLSRQAVRGLGRLSPILRWAAMDGVVCRHPQPVRLRDLNWELVSQVQKLPRWRQAKLPGFPVGLAWQLCGFPKGQPAGLASAPDPWRSVVPPEIPMACLVDLLAVSGRTVDAAPTDEIIPAIAIARFFRKTATVRRFAALVGLEWTPVGLHDLGQPLTQVRLSEFQEPHRSAWEALAMRTKGVSMEYAARFSEIRELLGRVPATLSETRQAVARVQYGRIAPEDVPVAEMAAGLGLSLYQFERYRDLCRTPQPGVATVPGVVVTGADVGLAGDWRFERLATDDPLAPALGLVTNCCQHLEGAAASAAMNLWTRDDCAAFVVRYDGRVVAQSYAWRSGDALCFDSIEALSGAYVEGIAAIYMEASRRLLGRLGITEILVGSTRYGITRRVVAAMGVSDNSSHRYATPPPGYADAEQQSRVMSLKQSGGIA